VPSSGEKIVGDDGAVRGAGVRTKFPGSSEIGSREFLMRKGLVNVSKPERSETKSM
jgi:hypothetical protein